MKHLLIILSFLLLSTPLFGDNHKGETLYLWKTSSGLVWKEFGVKETHTVYKGEVDESGKPNGLGFLISPNGDKYVGSWKNGKKNGEGTETWVDGTKIIGEWKNDGLWNGIYYHKNGSIQFRLVNGKYDLSRGLD